MARKPTFSQRVRALERLQDLMKVAFFESQANCPVITHTLKNSGYYIPTSTGASIKYTAPYADEVQKGNIGGNQTVSGYWRGSSYVRSHIRFEPPRTPNPFVDNAVKKAIDTFVEQTKRML